MREKKWHATLAQARAEMVKRYPQLRDIKPQQWGNRVTTVTIYLHKNKKRKLRYYVGSWMEWINEY